MQGAFAFGRFLTASHHVLQFFGGKFAIGKALVDCPGDCAIGSGQSRCGPRQLWPTHGIGGSSQPIIAFSLSVIISRDCTRVQDVCARACNFLSDRPHAGLYIEESGETEWTASLRLCLKM
jgi:hypothetical protein